MAFECSCGGSGIWEGDELVGSSRSFYGVFMGSYGFSLVFYGDLWVFKGACDYLNRQ